MDLPIRLREQRSEARDLHITLLSRNSWKLRQQNGGYWKEQWRQRPGGGTWLHRLRWRRYPCG